MSAYRTGATARLRLAVTMATTKEAIESRMEAHIDWAAKRIRAVVRQALRELQPRFRRHPLRLVSGMGSDCIWVGDEQALGLSLRRGDSRMANLMQPLLDLEKWLADVCDMPCRFGVGDVTP